jgi:hypothetical protein
MNGSEAPSPTRSSTDTDRPVAGITSVFWLAVAGAVVAAGVHVALVEFRFRVLHEFTWSSREFAWLSLGGYLVWFLMLALPLAVASLV